MAYLTDVLGLVTRAAVWVWKNGAVVGGLTAAVLTALYVWLTYGLLRLQQTPVVTAERVNRLGALEGDSEVRALRNSGQGAAFNVCVYQEKQVDVLDFAWLGSLGPGEVQQLARPIRINYIEDHPHTIWYQDARRRWYATRLAAHGYGLSSVWEGRKRFSVPATVRHNSKAETVVQFYQRLARIAGLPKWLKRWLN